MQECAQVVRILSTQEGEQVYPLLDDQKPQDFSSKPFSSLLPSTSTY